MNIYELIGIILGDGCINYHPEKRVYSLEIVGNVTEEFEYYQEISEFLTRITEHRCRLKVRHEPKGQSLRLLLYDKTFIEYLMYQYQVHPRKTFNAAIPRQYLPWKYSKHILRGLFETDGSLYFSRVGRHSNPSYPRLEIKTSSIKLVDQVARIMYRRGFRVHTLCSSTDKTIKIYVRGPAMLRKWCSEIGFNSDKNKTKVQFWNRYGVYLPGSTLADRKRLLQEDTIQGQQSVEA